VALLRLLFPILVAALLGGCMAKLPYDLPATMEIDQGSAGAAQLASKRLEEALGANGDFRPGDLVRISFPYMPTLDSEQRVQPSGFISPPLLSPLQTKGLTAGTLQQRLAESYKSKLRHPHVAVALVEYNRKPTPPEFFVLGEVIAPGPKEYRDGLTLMEAIARAGGANRTANLKKVVVVEPDGDRLVANMVDFESLLTGRGGGTRIVPVIGPNSIVIVPPTNLSLSVDRSQQIRSIIGFSGLHVGLPIGEIFK
jgi:protein involved in polysaccharide export with SLBB domain